MWGKCSVTKPTGNPPGRPPGVRNRATVERELRTVAGVTAAAATGILPLDILAARFRGVPLPDGQHPTDDQLQAAIAAAPYYHARLTSVDTTVKSDNVHRVISDEPKTEDAWIAQHTTPANDAVAASLPEDDTDTDAA